MRRVRIIGIGAGDPDHVTVQAVKALNAVDVFFMPDKGSEKADLKRLRLEICERHIAHRNYRTQGFDVPRRDRSPSYRDDVATWHAAIQDIYERMLMDELQDGECGAFLVWGDPALYDSTIRVIEMLHAKGLPFEYDVIPGISSVQALAAAHRIPLNEIGEPVAIVPGRRLEEALAKGVDNVVVVLDGDAAYRRAAGDFDIYWGAYVGTEDQRLVSGRLAEVADEIETTRLHARAAKGWIMDTYLLRRRRGEG
jgi:precorrin-6A synthase